MNMLEKVKSAKNKESSATSPAYGMKINIVVTDLEK